MKALLSWLTTLVVAVIVVVLAVHLILTAIALIRANRNLAQLVDGLKAIRDHTSPLGQDLSAINNAALTLKDRLMALDEHLRGIIQQVQIPT